MYSYLPLVTSSYSAFVKYRTRLTLIHDLNDTYSPLLYGYFSCRPENDNRTSLSSIKIIFEDPDETVIVDTLSASPQTNKLVGEQETNSVLDNTSEKRDLLNLDFKYNINCTPATNMNGNNIVLRNMFLMTDDTRHFLASPLANTENEFFLRKITPTSSPLTINNATVNNVNSTANTNPTGGDNSNINTAANHIIQNTVTQNSINTLSNKVTINQVNHMPKARPHTCEECGKAFMLKHHLLTHMRVHTGERPHACPECGKTFALKHCLSTHMLLHTSERPYKCLECCKTFTLKHHLVSIGGFDQRMGRLVVNCE